MTNTSPDPVQPNRQPTAEHPVDRERLDALTATLQEPNTTLLVAVAETLGMEQVEMLVRRTLEIEKGGGMTTAQGDRRRTPGGVFFYLARQAMTGGERRTVFGEQWQTPAQQAPEPEPPNLETALMLMRAAANIPANKKGMASLRVKAAGQPKQVKSLDSCILVELAVRPAPALPKGLPPVPEVGQTTVAVFIEPRLWSKVEGALKADPKDALIVEGFLVNDARRQITGLWAKTCTTRNIERGAHSPRY